MKLLPSWSNKITKDCKFLGEVNINTKGSYVILNFKTILYEVPDHNYPFMVLTRSNNNDYTREYFSDFEEARKYMKRYIEDKVTTHMKYNK